MEHLEALRSGKSDPVNKLVKDVPIKLIKYRELVSIEEPRYLKRFNPIYFSVENNSNNTIELLLLTVIRKNSIIGKDNRATIPLKTFGLQPNAKANYRLYAFDPFNQKFKGIEIHLTTLDDWSMWPVVDKWIGRAPEFSKKLKWYNFLSSI